MTPILEFIWPPQGSGIGFQGCGAFRSLKKRFGSRDPLGSGQGALELQNPPFAYRGPHEL